jgi:hypothetical protein
VENTQTDFTEGLVRTLGWIPRCEFCGALSTHEQTWSDRGPAYYCDKPECDKCVKEWYSNDHEYDQIDLRRGECLWAETSRFLTNNTRHQPRV